MRTIAGIGRAAGTVAGLVLVWIGSGVTVEASAVISVNVYAGNSRNFMFPGDLAGAPGVRTNHWNQLSPSALSLGPGELVDSSGTLVPGMVVSLSPGGSLLDRSPGVTNDNKMINTVVDKFDGSPGILDVSDVPYAVYNLYLYHRPDFPLPGDGLTKTRGGYFTLTNSSGVVQRRYISTQDKETAQGLPSTVNATDGSGYILADTTQIAPSGSFAQVDGGNYVKFPWLTNADFTVLMSAMGAGAGDDNGNVITDGDPVRRLKWCGFQIEEIPSGTATNLSLAEPVPDLLMGDSVVYPLHVLADFNNGTSTDVTAYPATSFLSDDTNVFMVTSVGTIQPLTAGVADLRIEYQGLSLTQSVTVLAPVALNPPTVACTNLVISSGGGGVTTASLQASFNGHTNVDVTTFNGTSFSGGPAGVVEVSSAGTVTALGEGSFSIVGSYGGLSATNWSAGIVASLEAQGLQLSSPDGILTVHVSVTNFDGSTGCPVYGVTRDGETIVAPSRLGLTLGGTPWREHLIVTSWSSNAHDSVWEPVCGERSVVRNHYNGLTVSLQETVAPSRVVQLKFRAYDEGVALAYHIPEQAGLSSVAALTEQTEFRFASDHVAWSVTSAQGIYSKTTISALPNGCERPLVLEMGTNLYAAVAEARLVDYARMKFNQLGRPNSLVSALHSAVSGPLPLTTPWRVIMGAGSPGALLENNDIIQNLNDPSEISDPSWIKPGKVIREVTLSTAGGIACVDFAVKHNLQYVEYDAGWYGAEGSDPDATAVDPSRDLDLQQVIDYGASNGVGVILYVNKLALANQIDILPPLYQSWGVKGIKFGFVNVGSHYDTAWLHEAIRKCATNQIMVDVHDEYRVTGYERTYPNLMTVEGIGGDETTPSPEQTLNILFTRMIAGAADHTYCYFDNRVKNNWTHAYQLAKAVCFYSPWQFLYWYDRPTNSVGYVAGAANSITDEPDLAFYDALPTVWDDTRVVRGSIGEYAVVARQSGNAWFMGAMNAGQTRTLSVPLEFLASGEPYLATRYSHDEALAGRTKVRIESLMVDASTELELTLTAANGEAWRFVAVAPPEFTSITRDQGGGVSLAAEGQRHVPVSLWHATNLGPPPVGWSLVTNQVPTNDTISFEHSTTTTAPGGFYRLTIP